MTKNSTHIRVYPPAWDEVRRNMPGVSDIERTKKIANIIKNMKQMEKLLGIKYL